MKSLAPSYDDLAARFADAHVLPQLPAAALKLSQMLDGGEASVLELERVILGDPALTAGVLRAATSATYGVTNKPITTIRQAILVLGQKSIRSVAVSLWVQSMVSESFSTTPLDPVLFGRHSIFVGFLSRYLFAINLRHGVKSEWSADELFGAGVLHDLGVGLLAAVNRKVFDRVYQQAMEKRQTMPAAFQKIYGRPLSGLAGLSLAAWQLPEIFSAAVGHCEVPLTHATESTAIACITYADYVAELHHHGALNYDTTPSLPEGVAEMVGLADEDLASVVELVSHHTRDYAPKRAA